MTYRTLRSEKIAGTFPGKCRPPLWGGRVRAAVLVALIAWPAVAGAADSILYRLFLRDGTSTISYGEFARVADRVVLSIPVGDPAVSPALQLISIPDVSVDW